MLRARCGHERVKIVRPHFAPRLDNVDGRPDADSDAADLRCLV